MVKIKLSALACAILVGGGQQLVAEDLNIFIDLEHYDPIYVNKETKIITGASINVNNNEELIYMDSLFFHRTGINITNNSNATFENEVIIVNPNFHINDSTAVFNEKLEIAADSDFTQPVIEKDNDFSGGNLSLDNSTLDIKEEARFGGANVLINHGSTATIDNLANYASKIYVVNDSNLEINNKANFVRTHLIVKDNSNIIINGALEAENGAIVDDEIVLFDDGGIEIDKSDLNVEGEAGFYNYDIELNNSSNATFKDKLTLIADSAMLLKNSSTLNVGGEANFNNSVVELNNNSTATFENEVIIQNPNFHINNSTAIFNEKLEIQDGGGFWPVIEQDNDFSGGSLSLNNSTLDIKKEAVFIATDALINHGSTATIDNFRDYVSEIYVVNDSKL
ncbi:MAG: hypothetical protein IJ953_04055, partial [Campylobacter sp.]|nr:hypothetical protein [Campylobacter sp.]